MALKSTSSPLDQYILSEWRTQLAVLSGMTYADIPTDMQTILNNIINEGFENLSERAAHHPWGQQETTLTVLTGTDTTYSMPAAFRNLLSIYEEATDDSRVRAYQSTKKDFYDTQEGTAHPWESGDVPVWFFDGLTSDQPPVQQWRRIGADNAGATAYVLFRPYFNLLASSGQDAYPYLPAAEGRALRERMLADWYAALRNYEVSSFHEGRLDKAVAELERADRQTVDDPIRQRPDPDFERQFS